MVAPWSASSASYSVVELEISSLLLVRRSRITSFYRARFILFLLRPRAAEGLRGVDEVGAVFFVLLFVFVTAGVWATSFLAMVKVECCRTPVTRELGT